MFGIVQQLIHMLWQNTQGLSYIPTSIAQKENTIWWMKNSLSIGY